MNTNCFLSWTPQKRGKIHDNSKKKDPKIKIYQNFLKSRAYENLKNVEKLGLPAKIDQLEQQINSKSFIEREAYLKNPEAIRNHTRLSSII